LRISYPAWAQLQNCQYKYTDLEVNLKIQIFRNITLIEIIVVLTVTLIPHKYFRPCVMNPTPTALSSLVSSVILLPS
jgi:hypothetical protein